MASVPFDCCCSFCKVFFYLRKFFNSRRLKSGCFTQYYLAFLGHGSDWYCGLTQNIFATVRIIKLILKIYQNNFSDYRTPEDFMGFVGLDKPPVEPSSEDINGQNRSQIVLCTHLFYSVIIRQGNSRFKYEKKKFDHFSFGKVIVFVSFSMIKD